MMPRTIGAATQFVQLLKFGAVRSIIYGFLIAVSCWRHILQCIVIVQSFLGMDIIMILSIPIPIPMLLTGTDTYRYSYRHYNM